MKPKTGDILLFKGNGLFSALIMAAPGAEYSHVGMFVKHPTHGDCVFESTSLGTLPDVITGEKINGVQLVKFEDRVKFYDGEVYHRPIIGPRTMTQHQAIYDYIDEKHGTPYEKDKLQLARAELDIFPWQLNKPDDSTIFCSENYIMCGRRARLIVDDGTPPNEGTPTDCETLDLMPGLTFGELTRLN